MDDERNYGRLWNYLDTADAHVQIRQSVPTTNPLNPPYQGDFGKCPLISLIHHSNTVRRDEAYNQR